MKQRTLFIKKLLFTLLAAMLVLTSVVPAFAVGRSTTLATNGSKYVVTASRLNVRSGPGMEYTIIGKAPRGTKVTFVSTDNGWWKVSFSNGTSGYVDKQYLTPASASETGKYYVIASRLNARTEPSTSGRLIGQLKYGSVVTVEKLNGDWAYVAYKGYHGWVATQYLSK